MLSIFCMQAATMQHGNTARNAQPEACSTSISTTRTLYTIKRLKQHGELVRSHASTLVLNHDL
jgi:hypothetical protein